jgi:hypothetical protein
MAPGRFSQASPTLPERFRVVSRIVTIEGDTIMKNIALCAALAVASLSAAAPASAQTGARYGGSAAQDEEARFEAAQRRFDAEYETFQAALERYRRTRAQQPRWDDRRPPAPRYDDQSDGGYDDPNDDPARDYRQGNYQERVLTSEDRVYRGNDGQYYCRRPDGTTGLIVGAAAGGLFGNIIAGRRSSTVGTLLGAIAGGAAGSSIDRNRQVRCR